MSSWWAVGRGLIGAALVTAWSQLAFADNQTPTTSPVSLNDEALPYRVRLERVDPPRTLPTLQSFASADHDGLWLIIGGRTNGLHAFTSEPLENFPPSQQNREVWVIDPKTWRAWSRSLDDSSLSRAQVDELSATATESVQVGDVLYIVGGYGYSRSEDDFTTFSTLTAIDLPDLVDWVRRKEPSTARARGGLKQHIRQTRHPALKVTGGQLRIVDGRAILAFGQDFEGGYGAPDAQQTYTGQVRSFEIVDNGHTVRIGDIRRHPKTPNLNDFRRRDYNLVPIIETSGGKRKDAAVALAGVFTESNGVFTVPVEIDRAGRPTMRNPTSPATFKQAMNGYDCAKFGIFDSRSGATHILLFGGISYVTFEPQTGQFVSDSNIPFTSDATVIVRKADASYRQYLLETGFPQVVGPDGAHYLFGAEAQVFLAAGVPTMENGLVDLRALATTKFRTMAVIGWVFGGIAAEMPNFGASVASNEVFAIVLDRH